MNRAQKIIWSVYLVLLLVLFITAETTYMGGDRLLQYLAFGWIPFAVATFIWRDRKKAEKK